MKNTTLKILFVSSGNSSAGISPIVKRQGESIEKEGIEVRYFTIKGKGFWGYLRHIFILSKQIKLSNPDLIHAHYSLTGFVASLASNTPIIVSLMGSDIHSNTFFKILIRLFHHLFWDYTIVKSAEMKNKLGLRSKLSVIPNGVDFDTFYPQNKKDCQSILKWNLKNKHILFAANPARKVKNFDLAKNAVLSLNLLDIELHVLQNIEYQMIQVYMNAADVVLLTSMWEGSPNVLKEGMSCNRPIVSTNVGDVEWLLGDIKGHFLTTFDPQDVSDKLNEALKFSANNEFTQGRERILELGLDSKDVAQKLLSVYKTVLQ